MSSFAAGFKMGGDMYDSTERNRLMRERLEMERAAELRAAEEFAWRRDAQRRENEAFDSFNNAAAGLNTQTQGDIQRTYGLTPGQTAGLIQKGGAAGLQSKLASYDTPDSYDLQNVPAAGMQPRFTADQVRTSDPSRMDLEKAMGNLALARRDVKGLRESQVAQRGIQMEDIVSRAAKMSDDEIADMFPKLNSRALSGLPIYDAGDVLGKDGKPNGYRTLRVVGKDGKPNMIELNPSQQREMAAAYLLMNEGFGQEGMTRLAAVSKDMAETVSKYNTTLSGATTSNNTATHYANADESSRITANAAATNAATNSSLRNEQIRGLRDLREGRETALSILDRWEKLTPEQQMGPEGDALMREFNLNNVKAGGTVSLGPKGGKGSGGSILKAAVEQKKNDDGTYTAFDKQTGQALYNTINGEAIPLGMDSPTYAAHKKAAQESGVKLVVGENNGRLELRYQGVDGKFYADAKAARYAKAEPAPSAGGLKKPSAAAPSEDTTKYVRSPGPRGGYTYTASPRGLTKAEYAEIDKKNGK